MTTQQKLQRYKDRLTAWYEKQKAFHFNDPLASEPSLASAELNASNPVDKMIAEKIREEVREKYLGKDNA